MSRKINKENAKYPPLLAQYMRTKEGQAFALSIISQLVDGFELDYRGKIKTVYLDDENPLILNME